MSVKGSKEFEIAADPATVMAAVAAVEELPNWAGPYKNATVESRYEDGRPKLVRAEVTVVGITDHQLVEYAWDGDRRASWTLLESSAQKLQIGSYTLSAGGKGTKVLFELELEPKIKMPGFLFKKVVGTALDTGSKDLKKYVEGLK
ncbi:SRPBCC family protein [Aldersonia sp. NBC_00410]|jgi:uncharacterized protein YndB with AHSA1/START domain|uniref:SRPBCC family protein n=1 Tax=Aldersonia sp. NBC_00410 TaxID=2975954 RepID=UPI002254BE57|nr:SRPBCC family protein [Aldersonia sp. NBC_00410]MCX5046587.1 SRPBCC family protein [Aldersonia sp. NBC_00410]